MLSNLKSNIIIYAPKELTGVTLSYDWVQLSDAAFNDLFFSKICIIKTIAKSQKWTLGEVNF